MTAKKKLSKTEHGLKAEIEELAVQAYRLITKLEGQRKPGGDVTVNTKSIVAGKRQLEDGFNCLINSLVYRD